MSKSKKFKRPKLFSKSNLTVILLAAFGIQAYPSLTRSPTTIESSANYNDSEASDDATIIENRIADNFNGRIPCQVHFTDSDIVIRIPKINMFNFNRQYIPYTLNVLQSIQSTKLPTSLASIKLTMGTDTQIFSVDAVQKANLSANKIKDYTVGEMSSSISSATYQNYYQQYLQPLLVKDN
jgi:hypothetical protein